jgi:hypothetical protein
VQERREQLLEELRKAEQARALLRELEQNLSKSLSENFSMNLEQRRISPRMGLPK